MLNFPMEQKHNQHWIIYGTQLQIKIDIIELKKQLMVKELKYILQKKVLLKHWKK